jgi:hypothetical protein
MLGTSLWSLARLFHPRPICSIGSLRVALPIVERDFVEILDTPRIFGRKPTLLLCALDVLQYFGDVEMAS